MAGVSIWQNEENISSNILFSTVILSRMFYMHIFTILMTHSFNREICTSVAVTFTVITCVLNLIRVLYMVETGSYKLSGVSRENSHKRQQDTNPDCMREEKAKDITSDVPIHEEMTQAVEVQDISSCDDKGSKNSNQCSGDVHINNYIGMVFWIIVLLLMPYTIQLLLMSVQSGCYRENPCLVNTQEENCYQDSGITEENNCTVTNRVNMSRSDLMSQQHRTLYNIKSKVKTSINDLRRYLKILMSDITEVKQTGVKQKLGNTLFPPRIDYHLSKVNIYPFTASLQSYIDHVSSSSELPGHQDMSYEIRRMMSFSGSSCPASPLLLARSGFYAMSGGPGTQCYSCRTVYSDWQMMDRPDIIHRRISPECPHLHGTDNRNVPIHTEGSSVSDRVVGVLEDYSVEPRATTTSETSTSLSSPSSSLSILDFSLAVYPQYRDLQSRLNSYQRWEFPHVQDPRILSEAGLYYAGYSDCVRCFYCGIGLRTWEKEDDPWVVHVRWRSSCDYVRCMKGEEFVISALAGNSSAPDVFSHLIPVNDNLQTHQVLNSSYDSTETSSNMIQGRQLTPADTSTGRFQSEPTRDGDPTRSLTGMSSRETSGPNSAQIVKLSTPESSENMSNTEDTFNRTFRNTRLDDEETRRQLEEENQSLRDESTCKVCMDNPSCIVFLPCGHLVTCAECAPALRKCPVCRAVIRGTVRCYSN